MTSATTISLKKRVALDLFSLKKSLEHTTHQLTYLFWECTTRCVLSCRHCGSDCSTAPADRDMPAVDFLSVLGSIRRRYDPSTIFVCLTGGEVLLRHDLIETGKAISDMGFSWGIVTSGYGITEKRFSGLVEAGMCSISVSLDGFEEEHVWLRGNPHAYSFSTGCIKLAASLPHSGYYFDVVTCVHSRNIDSLEPLKQYLIDVGVRHWRLVTIFPKGRAATDRGLQLDGEAMRRLLFFIQKTRIEGRIHASYGCEGFLGGFELEVRDTPFFCTAGIRIGSVLADGSISACPSLRSDYVQGSIYTDDFIDVWENRFIAMRNRSWMKTGECASCRQWRYCHGNALHLRDQTTGKLLFCHYAKLQD